MSKNIYDVFRLAQETKQSCLDKRSAAFIENGKLSKTIIHKRKNLIIKSALVFDYKEGPDEAIVYTYKADNLLKGDYFIFNDGYYLVYEDVKLTDESFDFKKQKAVECNITFTYNDQVYHGYYTSSLRRLTDPDFVGRQGNVADEQSLIILPFNETIQTNSEFIINNKPWKVVQYDDITNKGITYYYVDRNFIRNAPEDEEEAEEIIYIDETAPQTQEEDTSTEEEVLTLRPATEYIFTTEGAFFASNPRANVISRTPTSVKFSVPFGISMISITTRLGGESVEKTYEVKL